ncbi:DUF484 family protein [Halorhodospira halochloris]|uniref:DUF484 family protein n=1 Tax=Halorhodospira halochloris TaxID=1052 RepID=A0A110B4F2_HALHR|nr:DUF484 family protein [Halorhodospira halochloris]MBK1650806.1 hypothetical protein [Halorhodospira halochloris]MCG5530246.1 DUF484 family protein [Halorhodospira halochloris]MCG5547160.1 DUF484 family protein [Halorhodospira halochloris]BAU56695.1 protein of unknown function DUF484 [Halorhodospira halochloris]
MSQSAPEQQSKAVYETDVAEYLAEHPDFFARHPQILNQLDLRHECGDAISLIEYQVKVLREQNQSLNQRLHELLNVARHNDGTAERLHELTIELIRAEDLQSAVASLRSGLQEGFQADAVGIVLVLSAAEEERTDSIAEVVAADSSELEAVQEIFDSQKPLCGAISTAQQQVLFPTTERQLASAAVVPLVTDTRTLGLLGIGSSDPERYHAGQGTVFLRRLGTVAAVTLQRLLTNTELNE